jgi:AcrR family transcriptional regulator
MPSPDRGVRVEAIREAARLATEATSLRAVARAVGMSPMGLKHFLEGRSPYTATLRRLTIWFIAHGAEGGAPEELILAALGMLLEGLPASGRGRGRQALLDVVERMHRQAGTQPPAWLPALRAGGEPGD